MRKETDSLGEVEIDDNNLWGSQTERSKKHFNIGEEKVPLDLIYALAIVKKASAKANHKLNLLDENLKDFIVEISDEIILKKHDKNFPLSIWQTGSSTPINMNINEVISNIASLKNKDILGSKKPLHPNDHVNMGQSTNDAVPSAMNISSLLLINEKLLPALENLKTGFLNKTKEFEDIIKVGRTHTMDALPMTLGQEFLAFASTIEEHIENIKRASKRLKSLPLGGTAIGTGLNAHKDFPKMAIDEISKITNIDFVESANRFHDIAFCDPMVKISSNLKNLALSFIKIATDLTFLSSGPRCGIGEIILPANEPGSSIMPGKVNPTQLESLKVVSMQVVGNDVTVSLAASSGNFQINVFKTAIIHNVLQSIKLLTDVSKTFLSYCLEGIKPNLERIKENLDKNLMVVTILNTKIGYEKSAKIVQLALKENISLKEAALKLNFVDEKTFDDIIDLKKMVNPHE